MAKKLLIFILLVLFYVGLHASEVKSAAAVKTATPPVIDGLLTDPCWRKASFASGFYDFKTGKKAERETEFAFCFDADNIYVAVRCKCGSQYTPESSARFWNGDLLEFFFDPEAGGYDYFHIAVTPRGGVFKERGYGRSDALWAPHVRAAGQASKGEWTVEMALPLAEFGFRKPITSTWLINVARRDQENAGRYYTWAPAFGGLHQTAAFQPLTGLDMDISPFCWETDIGGDGIIPRDLSSIKLGIKNLSPKRRPVQLTMSVQRTARDQAYPTTNSLGTFEADANSSITVTSPPLFITCGDYFVAVEGRTPSNRLLFRSGRELKKNRDYLSVSTGQKVYYRNEMTCKAESQLFVSKRKLENTKIRFALRSCNGTVKAVNKDAVPGKDGKAAVEFDLKQLAPGDYEIAASWKNRTAKTVFSIIPRTIKYPEISINARRSLLVEGKSFFPRGLYMPTPWWKNNDKYPTDEKDWEDIKAKGFNSIIYCPFWRVTFMNPRPGTPRVSSSTRQNTWQTLDRIHKTGLKVLMSVSRFFSLEHPDMQGLRDYVSEFRGHPAVLCWYLPEEPDGGGIPPEKLEKAYRIIKELDPFHPVCLLVMGSFLPYRDAADIMLADRYPIIDRDSRPWNVIYSVSRAGTNALKTGQTFWMTLQFFCNHPQECWKRCPTAGEAVLMSFQAICGGARGLYYFAYTPVEKRSTQGAPTPYPLVNKRLSWELWEGSKRMNELLIAAEPFILGGIPDSEIRVISPDDKAMFIQNKVFCLGSERLIILCNAAAASATVRIEGLAKWRNIVDMDIEGERSIAVKGNASEIKMKPGSVRLLFCRQ
ncbi:MAG: sugar-binding protein [Victivallales bacterium]